MAIILDGTTGVTAIGTGLTGTASGLTAGNATTASACSGNSDSLVPVLVKAIQELKAIIDTQTARIEALEVKI